MDRPSRKARLRYAFANYMSRGTGALILGLFAITALAVVIIAVVVELTGSLNDSATQGIDFLDLVWLTMLRTLDPGTMGSDAGTVVFVFGMFSATVGGIVLGATLIGIINAGLATKLDELRKGHSQVIERDHIVILGWSPQIFPVISELVLANASRRNQRIVVLADEDMIEMHDAIRQRVPDTKTTRIVCRSGSPLDLDVLDISSP